MKRITFLLALAVPSLLSAEPAADAEGFVSLFNGKDLTGWENVNCAPDTWTVKDGMIHSSGKPTGALRLPRQYENFIFELEWRHLTSGGNAGIFIWSSALPAKGQPFLRAIEVQVLDHGYGKSDWFTTHGDVFAIHGATMKPFEPSKGMRSFPKELNSKGTPEWNHYRITCQDGAIRLAVNGKEVSGGENCVWRKGFIGLESEGAPVDWRNLKIKELPTSNPKPEECAPAAPKQARLLYSGTSLDGWKVTPDKGWKAADWQLVFSGSESSPATCESKLDLPVIQLDIQSTAALQEIPVKIGSAGPFPAALTNGWHRITLALGEKEIAWSVDGKPAGTAPRTAAAEDRLSLVPAAACKFGSLYLLEP